jgi:hypothetical protein
MANNASQHIINTAANLLGLCLFVITRLLITKNTESSIGARTNHEVNIA